MYGSTYSFQNIISLRHIVHCIGFDAAFCQWVESVYLNPHSTSDHAFVAKMLDKITLLKIFTGSNMCVGTYKTDTYEHMSISII
jgi:hypothetical protein